MRLNAKAKEFVPCKVSPTTQPSPPPQPPVKPSGEIDWFNVDFVTAITAPTPQQTQIPTIIDADEPDYPFEEPLEYDDYETEGHTDYPHEISEFEISSLLELPGCSPSDARFALRMCCGDIEAATQFLIQSLSEGQDQFENEEQIQYMSAPTPSQTIQIDPSTPLTLAEKLRLEKLTNSYPWIPTRDVRAAFDQTNRNLTESDQVLSRKFPKPPEYSTTTTTTMSSTNSSSSSRANHHSFAVKAMSHQPRQWVETGPEMKRIYEAFRSKAIEHAERRNALFRQAVVAYRSNDKALAKELGWKGREHNAIMHALHEQAKDAIYTARNSSQSSVSGTFLVDLHGLHVKEAVLQLQTLVKKGKGKGGMLYLIVGTGHHTFDGQARVGPALKQQLNGMGLMFVETQPGMLAVELGDR